VCLCNSGVIKAAEQLQRAGGGEEGGGKARGVSIRGTPSRVVLLRNIVGPGEATAACSRHPKPPMLGCVGPQMRKRKVATHLTAKTQSSGVSLHFVAYTVYLLQKVLLKEWQWP